MSDDIWRNDDGSDPSTAGRRPGRFEASMDDFDDEEFGGPLFGDDAENSRSGTPVTGENTGLSFGEDATGPLPHWSEPATGEMPKIEAIPPESSESGDVDVWSTFTSDSPVWKEGDAVDAPSGTVAGSAPSESAIPEDPTGELRWEDDPFDEPELPPVDPTPAGAGVGETITQDAVAADVPPRDPPRITIGTDPSGMPRRPNPARRGSTPQRHAESADYRREK